MVDVVAGEKANAWVGVSVGVEEGVNVGMIG